MSFYFVKGLMKLVVMSLIIQFNLVPVDMMNNVLFNSEHIIELGMTQMDMSKNSDAFNLSQEQIEELNQNIKPNEMGNVMVIMYHNLVDSEDKEGLYARSYANFRKDLERIHKEGYYLIRLKDLVKGDIYVPAGKTPMVLTFDDGHPSDIKFLPNGEIDPNCVVGILEGMKRDYPDFNATASFYLNSPVIFGDKPVDPKKIQYLIDNGYEVGNHTVNHYNIRKLGEKSMDAVKEEIFKQQELITGFTKENEFTFAVPFGEKPEGYREYFSSDIWLKPYRMIASLNVGWNPIKSPFSVNFDPYSINRITVGEDEAELHFWLDYFVDTPKMRFISDGYMDMISIPESFTENFNRDKFETANYRINIYQN